MTAVTQFQGPTPQMLELQASLVKLDRRDFTLWVTAICILLLLCFTVFSLSFPSIWKQEEIFFQERLDIAVQGLFGIVLLFSSFALYQQYLLRQTRATLAAEIAVIADLHGRAEVFERLSILDPLTGLFNRRFATQYLPGELIRATRGNYPLTVMMLNVDCFKKITETYGHTAGNIAVQEFARHLRKSIRSLDLPVHMVDDKFMVILPECRIQATASPIQRMKDCEFSYNGQTVKITFSVGSAEYKSGELPAELLQRAADNLYKANKSVRFQRPAPEEARVV
jgi:diguanylate cyclase (GGDEF)-like protein